MHVSTIICTRNRPDLIGAALDSVLANTYPDFDVVVVDQSDDDQTGQEVRERIKTHGNLRYVYSKIAGLSRAYNTGIRETSGAIIAFTDDDCIAPPDWIASVASAFDKAPDAELLYGQVLRPESLKTCTDIIPTFVFSEPKRFSHADGFHVCGMGANFAARRTLFERIGGFDEIMGGGGPLKSSQDFDIQYRAFRGRATVILAPEVKIDHYGVRTREQWPATERAYGIGDGAFYSKHIRCGDTFALWLLIQRLTTMASKDIVRSMLRKRAHWEYVRSIGQGILMSRRFGVNRRTRMYEAA